LPTDFDDQYHAGKEDAAFKIMIVQRIANIPSPPKSKTPDSSSPPQTKEVNNCSGEINQDSPDWNRMKLRQRPKKGGPHMLLNLDDEDGAMKPKKKA
jgi:hypothetical protein